MRRASILAEISINYYFQTDDFSNYLDLLTEQQTTSRQNIDVCEYSFALH